MMDGLSIENLKKIQLDILKDYITFCEKYELKYLAIYGTMLGAVRHQGYIPWDDDIDIAMPRVDYEKFLQAFNDEKYVLRNSRIDKNYAYPFTKVSLRKSSMIEIGSNFDTGINIDVFPLDFFPEDAVEQKIILKKIKILFSLITVRYSVKKNKPLLRFLAKAILSLFPTSYFGNKIDKVSRSVKNSSLMGVICWGEREKEIIPSYVYENLKEVPFENLVVKIPRAYDVYLKSIYGDYMQLPPVKDRVNRHCFTAYITK